MAQILQSLTYEEYSIILPKFNTFGLLILILSASNIMYQTQKSQKVIVRFDAKTKLL